MIIIINENITGRWSCRLQLTRMGHQRMHQFFWEPNIHLYSVTSNKILPSDQPIIREEGVESTTPPTHVVKSL